MTGQEVGIILSRFYHLKVELVIQAPTTSKGEVHSSSHSGGASFRLSMGYLWN